MGAFSSKNKCQCACKNTLENSLPPSYTEAMRASTHIPASQAPDDSFELDGQATLSFDGVGSPVYLHHDYRRGRTPPTRRPTSTTSNLARPPNYNNRLHGPSSTRVTTSPSPPPRSPLRKSSSPLTRDPQRFPSRLFLTMGSQPLFPEPKHAYRIYASSLPAWDWDEAQCRAWLTLLLTTRCSHRRSVASKLTENIVMAGFSGADLYLQDLQTWTLKLGHGDGFKVYSHMKMLKAKREARRKGKHANGMGWVETRSYLDDDY